MPAHKFFTKSFFTRSRILLFSCLAFIAGVGAASFFPEKWLSMDLWWFGGMTGCIAASVISWGFRKQAELPERRVPGSRTSNHWNFIARLAFLFLAFLFLGIWRYSMSLPRDYADKVWHYNGESVKFVGRVTDEPDARENNVKLKIDSQYLVKDLEVGRGNIPGREDNLKAGNKGRANSWPVNGRVLVTTNIYPAYHYGDQLEIECKLKKPDIINDFSYDRYLARYDIYSVCYYPKVKLVKPAKFTRLSPRWFYNQVLNLREGIKRVANTGMGEPESSLVQAITFGIRQNIPAELNLAFSQTGLTHIMAVSGMNVSILVMLIMNGLLALGAKRKIAFYATVGWIVGFIILVAMPASAIRAGLMGFLLLWALNLGRLNKMTNSIVLAGALMLVLNPKILRDDVGFQLSFLATMSLVYFYPLISGWYGQMKVFNFIPRIFSESILVTLAAQVLTLPVLIYNFHFVSLISPIANLLALWTILPIMIFTTLGIIFGFIFSAGANIIFFPAWILAKFLIILAKSLALVPFSHPLVESKNWLYFLIYYLILAIFIIRRNLGKISIDFS